MIGMRFRPVEHTGIIGVGIFNIQMIGFAASEIGFITGLSARVENNGFFSRGT